MPGTRKLGRPTAHRNSMLRGMVTYLLENGTIETTVYRAKEVRSMTEKMITTRQKEHTGEPPCCSFIYNEKRSSKEAVRSDCTGIC